MDVQSFLRETKECLENLRRSLFAELGEHSDGLCPRDVPIVASEEVLDVLVESELVNETDSGEYLKNSMFEDNFLYLLVRVVHEEIIRHWIRDARMAMECVHIGECKDVLMNLLMDLREQSEQKKREAEESVRCGYSEHVLTMALPRITDVVSAVRGPRYYFCINIKYVWSIFDSWVQRMVVRTLHTEERELLDALDILRRTDNEKLLDRPEDKVDSTPRTGTHKAMRKVDSLCSLMRPASKDEIARHAECARTSSLSHILTVREFKEADKGEMRQVSRRVKNEKAVEVLQKYGDHPSVNIGRVMREHAAATTTTTNTTRSHESSVSPPTSPFLQSCRMSVTVSCIDQSLSSCLTSFQNIVRYRSGSAKAISPQELRRRFPGGARRLALHRSNLERHRFDASISDNLWELESRDLLGKYVEYGHRVLAAEDGTKTVVESGKQETEVNSVVVPRKGSTLFEMFDPDEMSEKTDTRTTRRLLDVGEESDEDGESLEDGEAGSVDRRRKPPKHPSSRELIPKPDDRV